MTPFLSAFSLNYNAPRYLLYIKEELRQKNPVTPEGIKQFGKNENKDIKAVTFSNYFSVVNDLMEEIAEELK